MTRTNALCDIIETPDEGIVLADGARQSARIWRPADAGNDPVPAILAFLSYRKRDGTCAPGWRPMKAGPDLQRGFRRPIMRAND